MKKYEIWLGWYHLGQGYDPPVKPERVGRIEATSFRIACVIYEHLEVVGSLKEQMIRGDNYIEDAHFGVWYYNPKTNSNDWTGKYYESEEDALASFRKLPITLTRDDLLERLRDVSMEEVRIHNFKNSSISREEINKAERIIFKDGDKIKELKGRNKPH